jgi:uncharacterized protein YbjT (DUF2867 family)
VEIAGDDLTMLQMAATLTRVTGRGVRVQPLDIEQTRAFDPNLAALCEWMQAHDFGADIAGLRALVPDVQSLETWSMICRS